MPQCPKCAKNLPDGTAFCPACGVGLVGSPLVAAKKSGGSNVILAVVAVVLVIGLAGAAGWWVVNTVRAGRTAAVAPQPTIPPSDESEADPVTSDGDEEKAVDRDPVSGTTVSVPDVIGLDADEAETRFAEANLEFEIRGERAHPTVPEGAPGGPIASCTAPVNVPDAPITLCTALVCASDAPITS